MNVSSAGMGPPPNEELGSQLSAMFDDELPAVECELLARRLSRDEHLKARWARYALIGAAIRSDRGARLQPSVAPRVKRAIRSEPALSASPVPRPKAPPVPVPWWQPVAGAAVAASVATAAILWLHSGPEVQATQTQLAPVALAAPAAGPGQPVSYEEPPAPTRRVEIPSTSIANFVVAHFEVASPVAGQAMISALVAGGDPGTAEAPEGSNDWVPVDDVQDNAKVE